ncbi:MAG TPA: lactoylglutathione lyase [Sphingobacteriaceae bacterium]|nr:lactoylglutathione lyase [Sphingobacteriaceae bacterium]
MEANVNTLNWFEIPAVNIGRAQEFYEIIFDMDMPHMQEIMGMKIVRLPAELTDGKVLGVIVERPSHKPSAERPVIYLNANPDIQKILDRVEEFDGKVIMPKTEISSGIGFKAYFIDTEGNKIGLQAQN